MERAHDPEVKIAERYFLGELSDDEAEAFEAHYFECARCAEYVVEELHMMESGRDVAKALPANVVPIRRSRSAWQWLPAAAAAVLAVTLGIQTFMPPKTRSFEPAIVSVDFSASRSAVATERVQGDAIQLDIYVPPVDTPEFEIKVLNAENEVVNEPHPYPAERATEPISLVLTPLPAGTYNVVIEGVREKGNRSSVASYKFEVRGTSQGGRP